MKLAGFIRGVLAVALFSLSGSMAVAAPDEIQVYTEEMNKPGEFSLELHSNYALKGAKAPSYQGEKPGHHMLQITPEFSYGVTKALEAGMYLVVSHGNDA